MKILFKKILILATFLFSTSVYGEDFQTGSHTLTEKLKQNISKWYERSLKQKEDEIKVIEIRITGHTDERGSREYNKALGFRRAKATADYLVSLGVDATKIRIRSAGEDELLVSGGDSVRHVLNRRIDVLAIVDKVKKQEECKKCQEPHKNILSLYTVYGQDGLEKSKTGAYETTVETEEDLGVGIMYQRRINDLYLGVGVDTNENAKISIGVGF